MEKSDLKIRKCSDIDREYAFFEVVEGDDNILFDIGYSDDKLLEVSFHQSITAKTLPAQLLLELLEEGKKLADDDLD